MSEKFVKIGSLAELPLSYGNEETAEKQHSPKQETNETDGIGTDFNFDFNVIPSERIDASVLTELAKQFEQGSKGAREATEIFLANIAVIEAAEESVQDALAGRLAEDKAKLNSLLNHKVPAIRKAASLANLLFVFSSREPESRHQAIQFLDDLVEIGILKNDPHGPLLILRKRYSVSMPEGCSPFSPEENKEIQQALYSYNLEVAEESLAIRQDAYAEILGEENITLDQLLNSEQGFHAFTVPKEPFQDWNGKTKWNASGAFLVEGLGDGRLFPVESKAFGGIKSIIDSAIVEKVFLPASAFGYNDPHPASKDRLMADRNDNGKGFSEGKALAFRFFFYLLKRGVSTERKKEEARKIQEKMIKKATMTDIEFFLKGKDGDCLVVHETTWNPQAENGDQSQTFENVFFLVRRYSDENGTKSIQLLEIPDHLEDLLGELMKKPRPYLEGENFRGTPSKLGSLLRKAYGLTKNKVQVQS
ncbi:MAG: hypothetical protein ABH956_03475 [Candidatus Nealsonbacteria bacterium]